MRRLKNGLLIAFTLLLVAAGAVMPGIAGYLQDSYSANTQESRIFDSVSLTLRQDSELARVLRLLMEHSYIATVWENHTVHNKQQAAEEALDALEWMYKCGLLEDDSLEYLGEPSATPYALAAYVEDKEVYDHSEMGGSGFGGGELYAVAWDCWWPVEKGQAGHMIRMDDETGKILLAVINTPAFVPGEEVYVRMDKWKGFVEDHYGFKVTSVAELYNNNIDLAEFVFYVDLEDGGDPFTLDLQMNYDSVYLIPCMM